MPPPPPPLGLWIPDPGCGREGGTREVLVQGTSRLRRALRGVAAQPALSLAGFLLASGLVWWQVKEDGGGRSALLPAPLMGKKKKKETEAEEESIFDDPLLMYAK